jgi:hypothetical protein
MPHAFCGVISYVDIFINPPDEGLSRPSYKPDWLLSMLCDANWVVSKGWKELNSLKELRGDVVQFIDCRSVDGWPHNSGLIGWLNDRRGFSR